MRSIGLRAEPTAVFWAVVEGTRASPILIEHDKITVPSAYQSIADQFTYVRQRLIDEIERNHVESGAIRFPEYSRRNAGSKSDDTRLRMEGVLIEACAAANIPLGVAGPLGTIGRYVGSKAIRDYLTSDDLRGLAWPRKDKKVRESILVAVAALEN